MRGRPSLVSTSISAVLAGLCSWPAAAENETAAWGDFRLGQFISSRGRTPGDILGLDNNGDILLACRDGCTRATLEAAGVPVLGSQLELLRAWSLLAEDEAGLRTAIPVVDAAGSKILTERASELTDTLADAVAAEVAEVVAALEAEGWGGHAYAVLFSYILDGMVWIYFDERELVGRRGVSRGGAPWGGEAWAYLPTRELEPRTTVLRRDSMTVKLSWVEPLRPLVASLLSGPLSLRTLFADFLEQGKTASPELRAKLIEYGLIGRESQLTVPVIEQDKEDKLFALCDRLSTNVAETVITELDRSALVADLGLQTQSQALVIGYHEIMWSLMERLVESGAIALPAAIADPSQAVPADVAALVVMTRSPSSDPATGDREEG